MFAAKHIRNLRLAWLPDFLEPSIGGTLHVAPTQDIHGEIHGFMYGCMP